MEQDKQLPLGVLVNGTFKEILENQASKVGESWYYLPYWFKVTDDKIIAFHLNDLPDSLKSQIQSSRDTLVEKEFEDSLNEIVDSLLPHKMQALETLVTHSSLVVHEPTGISGKTIEEVKEKLNQANIKQ